MPCCPRSVDATWGRTNLRSSLPSSIAQAKSAVCPVFAVLPSNFKRPYLFNAWPIWVNFMSNQRVFRALRGNRAILEEWTEKEGPFFLMWGLFRVRNHRMALLVTWGTGLRGTEIRMPCCPRSVDATWEERISVQVYLRLSPRQSWLFVLFSLFCPPTSKGHIFSTARPIWVNFMSNQRVFRALRGNRAILEEWTKKRGPFFLMWGLFRAKNTGMALLVTWGTGL